MPNNFRIICLIEMNTNTTLLSNNKLIYSIKSADDFAGGVLAAQQFMSSFGTGIQGLITGLPNLPVVGLDSYYSNTNPIVEIVSQATDSLLANNTMGFRMSRLDRTCGLVFQDILCNHYKYRKISVFYSNDIYGTTSYAYLIDEQQCKLTVLSSYSFASETKDYSEFISDAKSKGTTIFVLFVDTVDAAQILYQGY